jgi:hypothetical protein
LDVDGSEHRNPFADLSEVFFGDTEVEVRAKMLIFLLQASPAAGWRVSATDWTMKPPPAGPAEGQSE